MDHDIWVKCFEIVKAKAIYTQSAKMYAKGNISGLQIRVYNQNIFFLFVNQNICCGYSKEPSQ